MKFLGFIALVFSHSLLDCLSMILLTWQKVLTDIPLWTGFSINNWAVCEMSLLLVSLSSFSPNENLQQTIGAVGSHDFKRQQG